MELIVCCRTELSFALFLLSVSLSMNFSEGVTTANLETEENLGTVVADELLSTLDDTEGQDTSVQTTESTWPSTAELTTEHHSNAEVTTQNLPIPSSTKSTSVTNKTVETSSSSTFPMPSSPTSTRAPNTTAQAVKTTPLLASKLTSQHLSTSQVPSSTNSTSVAIKTVLTSLNSTFSPPTTTTTTTTPKIVDPTPKTMQPPTTLITPTPQVPSSVSLTSVVTKITVTSMSSTFPTPTTPSSAMKTTTKTTQPPTTIPTNPTTQVPSPSKSTLVTNKTVVASLSSPFPTPTTPTSTKTPKIIVTTAKTKQTPTKTLTTPTHQVPSPSKSTSVASIIITTSLNSTVLPVTTSRTLKMKNSTKNASDASGSTKSPTNPGNLSVVPVSSAKPGVSGEPVPPPATPAEKVNKNIGENYFDNPGNFLLYFVASIVVFIGSYIIFYNRLKLKACAKKVQECICTKRNAGRTYKRLPVVISEQEMTSIKSYIY